MKKLSSALAFGMVLVAAFAHSEPKVIKNIRVSVEGKKQYFDLFQSAAEENLWYCGQTKPTVLMRNVISQQIPEISLIRFQKKDIKNPQKLVEGAHFRMHLSLGAAADVMEELKKKLPSSGKRPPVLSPVPFSALKLVLQKPDGKEVEMKSEPLVGNSGQRSSQNVAFSTILGSLDTDLLDALLRGNTGAKYTLFYNYRYLDPVFTGKPAAASADPRDSSAQNGGSSPDRNLPGTRDFSTMEKEAAASVGWEKAGEGFVGFSRYSKAVQDKCIFVETAERWQNAYLTLPILTFPAGISVSKIELDVSLVHSGKKYQQQKFNWTPAPGGWRDINGAPLVYGVFPLGNLARLSPEELQKVKFSIRQTIDTFRGEKLVSETFCDMVEGDTPISDPLDIADILEFETGMLTWAPEGQPGLKRIDVALTDGDWKSGRVIEPEFSNGRMTPPSTSMWLIRQASPDESVLAAEVFFIVSDGKQEKKVAWAKNGKNLRKELFALSAFFVDKDWSGK